MFSLIYKDIKFNLKYWARNKEKKPGKVYLAFFHSSDILAKLCVAHALLYGFKNFIYQPTDSLRILF